MKAYPQIHQFLQEAKIFITTSIGQWNIIAKIFTYNSFGGFLVTMDLADRITQTFKFTHRKKKRICNVSPAMAIQKPTHKSLRTRPSKRVLSSSILPLQSLPFPPLVILIFS